jgi:ABC-type multidrug transport system permease subunit
MLRTALLVFQNEFRLLAKDRAAAFMLVVAPIVIIAVAGFSLSNMFGVRAGGEPYTIVVVDLDHGAVSSAIIQALRREPSLVVLPADNLAAARAIVGRRGRAPLAILIPANTTRDFEAGRDPRIELYVDPVKRLEAQALELRLSRLFMAVTAAARSRAVQRMAAQSADLRARLAAIAQRIRDAQAQIAQMRGQFARAQAGAAAEMRTRLEASIEKARAQTLATLDGSIASARAAMEQDLSARRDALAAVARYLDALQASRAEFERWLAALKAAAGSHAADIPAPPRWPAAPSAAVIAELRRPIALPAPAPVAIPSPALPEIDLKMAAIPPLPEIRVQSIDRLAAIQPPAIPGALGWREQSIGGGPARVNSFDLYVPGFGITFLLIDMLWGVGVGLIDERDWGTLARLRISGAAPAAMMVGKLMARFVTGVGQMIVLFAVGWAVFGISLGPSWWALLIPSAAIAFAAAAFSLLIACVANTRDAVLPIGAMAALAMAAVGGCWWPLDFEPHWMRTAALAMPTTWTMHAYNNLMIRAMGAQSAVIPALITIGLGLLFLGAGILGSARIFR